MDTLIILIGVGRRLALLGLFGFSDHLPKYIHI